MPQDAPNSDMHADRCQNRLQIRSKSAHFDGCVDPLRGGCVSGMASVVFAGGAVVAFGFGSSGGYPRMGSFDGCFLLFPPSIARTASAPAEKTARRQPDDA